VSLSVILHIEITCVSIEKNKLLSERYFSHILETFARFILRNYRRNLLHAPRPPRSSL